MKLILILSLLLSSCTTSERLPTIEGLTLKVQTSEIKPCADFLTPYLKESASTSVEPLGVNFTSQSKLFAISHRYSDKTVTTYEVLFVSMSIIDSNFALKEFKHISHCFDQQMGVSHYMVKRSNGIPKYLKKKGESI